MLSSNTVWIYSVDVCRGTAHSLQHLLTIEEQLRAERFQRAGDAERFVVGRGSLRAILGTLLHQSAHTINFTAGSHGKPQLAAVGHPSIRFNTSHAGTLVVHAVGLGQEVGIDVELVEHDFPASQIAARFFTPAEQVEIARVPPEEQQRQFYRFWTCKEAATKCIGLGLTLLDRIEVTLFPAAAVRSQDVLVGSKLYLSELTPKPEYTAAVAYEFHSTVLSHHEWFPR